MLFFFKSSQTTSDPEQHFCRVPNHCDLVSNTFFSTMVWWNFQSMCKIIILIISHHHQGPFFITFCSFCLKCHLRESVQIQNGRCLTTLKLSEAPLGIVSSHPHFTLSVELPLLSKKLLLSSSLNKKKLKRKGGKLDNFTTRWGKRSRWLEAEKWWLREDGWLQE